MNLCHYSKSEVLQRDILPSCPLGLSSTEAKRCSCRKREYHVTEYDLRVLSCTHPQLFDGSEIFDERKLVANLRRRLAEAKDAEKAAASPKSPKQTELPIMATAEATAGELVDAEFTIDGAAVGGETEAAEAGEQPKRRGRPKKGEQSATSAATEGKTTTAVATINKDAGTVAVYERITDLMQFVDSFGVTLFQSGMFGLQNPSQGKVLALACAAKRMNPIDVLRQFDVVEGKLSMKASAMLGELRARGGTYEVLRRDAEGAALRITYGSQVREFAFTWEEAQKEPFVRTKDGKGLKHNWASPRARTQMLWARTISDAVRTMAPEIASGIYCPEELGDTCEADAEPTQPPVTVQATVKTVQPAPATPAAAPPVPAAAPPPTPTPSQAATAQPDVLSAEQLNEIAYYKQALAIGGDVWSQLLGKFGVTTAKALPPAHADKLIAWLTKKADEAGIARNEIPF